MRDLADRWAIWRLERRLNKDTEELKVKMNEARKGRNAALLAELQHEDYSTNREFRDLIEAITSHVLVRRAVRLDLPVPSKSEDWERSEFTGEQYLSQEGRKGLRQAIRKEETERHEEWARWLKVLAPFLAALTGVTGAAIGLISALKK